MRTDESQAIKEKNSPSILNVRGERELLEAARREQYAPWAAFRCRLLAAGMRQIPAYDHLLALNVARGIVPLEYQRNAVRQLLDRMRGRGLLCDEVGMGKTIEAGLAMLELALRGLVRRILILAPPSLLGQWKEEMAAKFQMDFTSAEEESFQGWEAHDRIIASIHTAKREPHAGRLESRRFDLVIVDEAHHLRSAETQNFRLVARLRPRYLFLLTATPVQNRLEDVFSLVSLVRAGQLSTLREFRRAFVQRTEPLLARDPERLRSLLRDVMIRNRRATSGARFTRRYATTVRIEMSDEERRLYQEASALVRRLYAGKQKVARVILRVLQAELGSSPAAAGLTLAKLGAEAQGFARRCEGIGTIRKLEKLVELVRDFGDRMIVFTRFQATHQQIVRALERANVSVAMLHGGMRFRQKQESLQQFQSSARVLVSTDVGSEGRNLQFCNAIVNFDLPWNPMKIEQRIGRVSRVGQEREVYVFNLVSAGTLEDHLLDLLHAKINMFELVIGEIDPIIGHLEEEERSFEEILMELWCSEREEGFARSMEELARQLIEAKGRYLQIRQVEDRLFGDELATVV